MYYLFHKPKDRLRLLWTVNNFRYISVEYGKIKLLFTVTVTWKIGEKVKLIDGIGKDSVP